ncbi:MAG: ABC transporter permease [Armatimonadetes bacterium]|nr:ABC transporter permease [Armatimonadota bacterium]
MATLAVVLFGVLGPVLTPYDPIKVNMDRQLLPPGRAHWFGTDEAGRDLFTRMAHGARFSLGSAAAIIGLATAAGFLIGGFSGYLGGRLDEAVMRLCDLIMAFPLLILAMAIAIALGPGLRSSVVALAAAWWPSYARLVRGMVLILKEALYVEAARAAGAPAARIVLRHILPHTIPAVSSRVTMDLGFAIVASSGLSFIGLGAQQPTPEWGSMIATSRTFFMTAWWYGLFPGLAIFATVLGISLVGDALQDALDPRRRGA